MNKFFFSSLFLVVVNLIFSQKVMSDEYEILNKAFNSSQFESVLKKSNQFNNKKIFFLENKFIKSDTYFNNKKIVVKSSDFFLQNLIGDFFYVFDIVVNDDLAKLMITHKNSVGITIYLEKNKDWIVNDYIYKSSFRLKDTPGTNLCSKIKYYLRKEDDKNILKITRGMSLKQIDSIMNKKLYYNESYQILEYKTPLFMQSYKVIFDVRNDKVIDIIQGKGIRKNYE